ncbi:hypothetical protein RNJ44_04958 [Nakaseomyces bracarensis]|uniref:Translation initiation factor eIF2B subunit delta n=1 Tax=Nakaseomyces bracarensis TaxID=273131 RepID=A0ABR4NWQ1_9SACH
MSEEKSNDVPEQTVDGTAPAERKLTNKELKELKKQEKAAKRAAQKQANGISIEQQKQQAEAKKQKKQQQREKQLKEQQKKQQKAEGQKEKRNVKKTTLFGHLETTEERRATILAITSAISSPKASRITAAGLMVPAVASSLAGASIDETISSTVNAAAAQHAANVTAGSSEQNAIDLAKNLATISLDSEKNSVVPGISSVIPEAMEQTLEGPSILASVKELLLNKDMIHPAISLLTSNLANYKIVGSIPRCIAMLEAFQIVINDYETPTGTTLSRNLTNYLSHQIDILKKARPLSVTMGNAIRWLKQEISLIDPATPDKVAKQDLCEKIAQFAREKIELADQLIIDNASNHIENSTTIVTYGSSKVLTELLLHNAVALEKNIQVIVVDSRPLFEGRKMAKLLRSRGVNVTYCLITSLDTVFNMDVDYVFLGAHSILSNGFLYSRAGSAMIAMTAKRRNIPVLVCCESLKFSQRVQLDSVTYNELADPNDLVPIDYENPVERRGNQGTLLEQFVKERKAEKARIELEQKNKGTKQKQQSSGNSKKSQDGKTSEGTGSAQLAGGKNVLDNWQDIPSFNIVNILYDLTPPGYIKKVITEFGALPPSSVPVILREYKGSA